MRKEARQKAEDILVNENISTSTFPETTENSEAIDIKDVEIAKYIYTFLKTGQLNFPEADKEQTRNRINTSIRKLKLKRHLIRLSAAAAILVICIFTGILYSQMNSTSEIANFAQTIKESIPCKDTKLILQDGREVRIDNKESEISYTSNGKHIAIGTNLKVVQSITPQKPSFNTVIVPYGKRTLITLSEGTKIWLNSGSKLVYPAVFSATKREVYIDGEAVFEVTPSNSKPFYVQTRDFDVKVLGTVFNVSAYADDKNSSTVLSEGKIELSYKRITVFQKEKLTILPGTRAVFDPEQNTFMQIQVNPQDYLSWHEGYLIFHSEKLINILKKITRYYNVEMVIQDVQMQNETFSGNLDLKNSPTEVLDVIAQTTPFKYEYENDKLVLTHNN